ncbi:hypothetical protein AXE65_01225 [Ventosimonas gracilis]|uniref:Peptidyl-prolyl cis-trans isomerase n=1 Tax=Ventosimonas gracilis TaxID=1680762 RepID=A0A139SVB2_9GAMM|nr:peptidylprolyl isomerase [Ventosimonas gracilis]KXU38546.1 hypothetical protein AXE65_01225 [Ventosimonas gracilis]
MLKKLWFSLILLLGFSAFADDTANPRVLLDTSLGEIELELNAADAPISVANFLAYVDSGFYQGTQFHRVISGFMVQGGGFDENLQPKQALAAIQNESQNGLANRRGTIAYARTADPHSATSQFFINLVDNAYLNGKAGKPGYTVFGRVIRGMEVVDKIAKVPTGLRSGMADVPSQTVLIRTAKKLQ